MAELFPEDPKLLRFACRYTFEGFDPAAVRPIVSPQAQMRPVNRVRPSIEQVPVDQYNQQSPHMAQRAREISARPTYAHEVMQQQRETSARPVYGMGGGPMMPPHLNPTISPKRGYDDASDSDRPRKLARGESPLKGAAGRRLDQQRRVHGNPAYLERAPGVATIPRDITFLLSIMPSAELYKAKGFNPERMVDLIGRTRIPEWDEWERDHKPRIQMMQRRPY